MTGDIGLGALEAFSAAGELPVLAVYRRAVYLSGRRGIAALTTMAAPAGPLHLRRAAIPPCRVGERVRSDGSTLRGPRWELSLDLPAWVGSLPPPGLLPAATLPIARIAEHAARLGGRGPGLTPEGDDVLAGLLLVAAAQGSPPEGLAAIAASVRTTAVASAFLAWAARGQCIAPAHDVLAELAVHGPHASTPACARLTAVGASSGGALLAGIRFGLQPDLEHSPATPLL